VVISSGFPDGQDTNGNNGTTLNEISEMEDSTCGGDSYSADESTFSSDEASSSSYSSASIAVREHKYEEQLWRFELPFSHNLAILFIKSVRTQGRIECYIRKKYARLTLASPKNGWMTTGNKNKRRSRHRKRKCSEEFSPDDMTSLQLKESLLPVGSFCSSTDSCGGSSNQSLVEEIDASMLASRSYTEHGLNSRRVKSSSNLQV
jgi:hypothetical protein